MINMERYIRQAEIHILQTNILSDTYRTITYWLMSKLNILIRLAQGKLVV